MKLSNCIERDWIRCGLTAENRSEALEETISVLPDEIQNDVQSTFSGSDEEDLFSTFSVGQGIAFPHARTEHVKGIKAAIGLFPEGVSFSDDGTEDVRIIVLFLFSEKRSGMYLKTLSSFSKVFSSEVHLENIVQSTSPQALLSYLEATGSQMVGDFSLHDLVVPPENVLRKGDTMRDALDALMENPEDWLPVVDNEGTLLGRVSHARIIQICLQDYGVSLSTGTDHDFPEVFSQFLDLHGNESVDRVLETDVLTVNDTASLFEATWKLVEADASSAMVTADGRLVGIFRLSDWTDKIFQFGLV